MANPFTATVGLKGVTSPEPPVLVNNLPGISTELVEALSDGDAADATAVWANIQTMGLEKLRNLIEGELSKSADFRYISERSGDLIGQPSSTVQMAGSLYRGYSVKAPVVATDELYIKRLWLDSAMGSPVTTNINVFSASGQVLATKSVTVQPNYNSLDIDVSVRAQFGRSVVFFIGIDVTGVGLRTIGDGQAWNSANPDFTMEPAIVAAGGPFAVTSWAAQTSTAVMLDVCVRRSLIDVIARYTDRLNWAYAHVCGSLLMAEKLGSSNVNLFTNTNRNFTEDREAKFMDEAVVLVKPIARDMLKELASAQAVAPKTDAPFDPGYSSGSFV